MWPLWGKRRVLVRHVVCPAGSSLTPRAMIRSAPSGSGRCSFKASSGAAVIQVSTSSGVVRTTGISFGWMAPTSAFGSVVNDVVSLVADGPGRTSRLARIAPDAGFRVDQMLPERQLPLRVCLPHHCARNRPRKKTFEGSARAHSRPDAPLRSALEHFPPWRNRKGIPLPGQIMIHVEGW